MDWSSELPKEPGYYWGRKFDPETNELCEGPDIYQVDKANQGSELVIWIMGWEVEEDIEQYIGWQWYGPLKEPPK